jgi:hypothetical protein
MDIDLVGVWNGTFQTDGLWFIPNLFDQKGRYVGGEGFGGPPVTANVSLEILWQGEYQNFYYALKVSPFYGDLVGVQQDSIPVSGFVNTYGFIKFGFYVDRPAPAVAHVDGQDWAFDGYITTHGGFHNLSGSWAKTDWNDGVLFYQLGTLSGRRKVSFKERASMYLSSLIQLVRRGP